MNSYYDVLLNADRYGTITKYPYNPFGLYLPERATEAQRDAARQAASTLNEAKTLGRVERGLVWTDRAVTVASFATLTGGILKTTLKEGAKKGGQQLLKLGVALGVGTAVSEALERIEDRFDLPDATSSYISVGVDVVSIALARRRTALDSRFRLAEHGDMPAPRPGQSSHHGVMSAWMRKYFPNYIADRAPAVLMPEANHLATFAVYNKWRSQMRRMMGGTFDWGKVLESEMRQLSEDMFDAAKVPAKIRQEYWDWFDRMKAALSK